MILEILAATAAAWPADRSIYSASDWLNACETEVLCKGYIDGAISTAMMYRALSYQEHKTPEHDQRDLFCPPNGSVSLQEEYRAIYSYVKKHPETLSMHAPVAIVNGLSDAFPCKP